MSEVPVITIDGPSGVGKGTVSQLLAAALGWHWFDSGALYRIVAWACHFYQIPPEDVTAIVSKIQTLDVKFTPTSNQLTLQILVDGHDVTQSIRTEACGQLASKISSIPVIRHTLLAMQRRYRQLPGLVTDGRDMGTVVFPDALLKIFLTASTEVRAERRYKQLQQKGLDVSLRQIFQDLIDRDERDANRAIAPAKPATDAIIIDTSELSIDEVMVKVNALVEGVITAR